MSLPDWDAVAAAWDRYFEWNAACLAPLIEWTVGAIQPVPGMCVLDVAGGSGIPSLEIARRFPAASVMSVDRSPDMVRLARRRAQSMQLANVEFRGMDATHLDFADASFDAVTFTFGLMLCAEPAVVVKELQRVLKPGGRFAIVVWDAPSRNPFLAVFGRAALEVLALPKPERGEPGPFRFADAVEFASVLRAGGFASVAVHSVEATMDYESVDAYLTTSKGLSPGLGPTIAALPARDAERFDALVRANVSEFTVGSRLRFPAAMHCAGGVNA